MEGSFILIVGKGKVENSIGRDIEASSKSINFRWGCVFEFIN